MTRPRQRLDPPFALPCKTSPAAWRGVVAGAALPVAMFLAVPVVIWAYTAWDGDVRSWAVFLGAAFVLFWMSHALANQFSPTVLESDGFHVGWRSQYIRFTEIRTFDGDPAERRATVTLHSGKRAPLSFRRLDRSTTTRAFRWIEQHIGANVFE